MFTKPGKKCTYLLQHSCHPSHIHENIPYSLALRLRHICSKEDDFKAQLILLKCKLLERGYRSRIINDAFARVALVDRTTSLRRKPKKKVNRVVLPIPFDPRLPSVSKIIHSFWKVMVKTPRLKRIFPDPPMVCWTRPKNLREHIIKAKLPLADPPRRSQRQKPGFKHCDRNCLMCTQSPQFSSSFTSTTTKETFPIECQMTCTSSNLIYLVTCTK